MSWFKRKDLRDQLGWDRSQGPRWSLGGRWWPATPCPVPSNDRPPDHGSDSARALAGSPRLHCHPPCTCHQRFDRIRGAVRSDLLAIARRVKIVLVTALLRNKLWAYPWMIAFLIAFIAYQVYRMTFAPSVGLVALTIFDAFVA